VKKKTIVDEIVKTGILLYTKDFVYATNGNISVRDKKDIYITPTSLCKGKLKPKDIILVDTKGKADHGKPSIELHMHLGIYANRKDINAVILAHPFFANLIGIQPGALNLSALPNMEKHLKDVDFIPHMKPGSPELAKTVAEVMKKTDIVVIHRYGTVCAGKDLNDALYKIERLEYLAKFLVFKQIMF
jgi:L-fuculose-phosphate aldolase